jgi:hypothetical protein
MSSKIEIESGFRNESEVSDNDNNDEDWNERQSGKDCVSEDGDNSFYQQSVKEDQVTDEEEKDFQNLQSDRSRYDKMVVFFEHVCQSCWFQIIFISISVVHNAYMVIREETRYLGAASFALDILFASLYLVETLILIATGRFISLMRESIFNRLDFVAMLSIWIQIAGRSNGINFTLCSLRLLRLLHPLTQYGTFSVLDAILHTLNRGWASVGTMLALIAISTLIQGVVGVYAYAGSFRRRCVWADSMEVKIPEQWCSRYEENSLGQRALGVHNNCGPLQVCHDIGNPDRGFTSFDHVGGCLPLLLVRMNQASILGGMALGSGRALHPCNLPTPIQFRASRSPITNRWLGASAQRRAP